MELKLKNNNNLKLSPITELEYIESTGTQYIPLRAHSVDDYVFVIECEITQFSNYKQIIGGRQNDNVWFGVLDMPNNNFGLYKNSSQASVVNNTTVSLNTRICVKAKLKNGDNYLEINGNKSVSTTSSTIPVCNISILGSGGLGCKLYSIKIYETDNLLYNLIPANYDGKAVLYDTVSKTFFYNHGTGDFIAGPVVTYGMHPALLKASSLYHENCPNVNGWDLLNKIYNWNINNQTEVKYLNYKNSATWQTIITQHPEFEDYAEANHQFLITICEQENPINAANQFAAIFEQYPVLVSIIAEYPALAPIIKQYPALAPIIAEYPEVVNSLVDTGKEAWLANNTNAFIDTGMIMQYTYNSYFKFNVVSYTGTYNTVVGARLTSTQHAYWFGYTSDRSYVELSPFNSDPFTPNFNSGTHEISIVNGVLTVDGVSSTPNYNQNTYRNVYLFAGNGVNEPSNSKISYFKVEDSDGVILWLVPIKNNGNPCMIDILTGTKYLNQGTGSFIYTLEDKQ